MWWRRCCGPTTRTLTRLDRARGDADLGLRRIHDDYLKVTKQTHSGFAGRLRLAIEAVIALAACYALCGWARRFLHLAGDPVPEGHGVQFRLVLRDLRCLRHGRRFANAVNLTDGLDGLAIVLVMTGVVASFGMISYLTGNAGIDYLQINYVVGTGELAVLCGAVLGAGLDPRGSTRPPCRFSWADRSLALGGMLGAIAVAVKHEIVLAVIGGLFVLEAVSVIVRSPRLGHATGKRVFRWRRCIIISSKQKGWTEPQIGISVLDHLGDAGARRPPR